MNNSSQVVEERALADLLTYFWVVLRVTYKLILNRLPPKFSTCPHVSPERVSGRHLTEEHELYHQSRCCCR